jgi:F-box and WD-40 domain protein CDC4
VWDVDTGECLHELRGHYHQIYVVAFDGVRIASAGLDTTVRVWDAETGYEMPVCRRPAVLTTRLSSCLALLQGHTALVCQLLLDPTAQQLVTGGSDGRVITFSTAPGAGFAAVHRIPAHDSSVTALQRAGARVLSAGNDGRVRAFAAWDGAPVRDLGVPADSVWKLAARANSLVVCSRRAGKTVTEIWSFAPEEEKMRELHELFR